ERTAYKRDHREGTAQRRDLAESASAQHGRSQKHVIVGEQEKEKKPAGASKVIGDGQKSHRRECGYPPPCGCWDQQISIKSIECACCFQGSLHEQVQELRTVWLNRCLVDQVLSVVDWVSLGTRKLPPMVTSFGYTFALTAASIV